MNKKRNLLKCAIQALNAMNKSSDERVALETNKIFRIAYSLLTFVLVFSGIFLDNLDITQNSNLGASDILSTVIGIISYGCLIAVCKKGVAEENFNLFIFFVWSVISLPLTLWNITIIIVEKVVSQNFFENNFGFMAAGIFVFIIIVSIILYIIANNVYRNNN